MFKNKIDCSLGNVRNHYFVKILMVLLHPQAWWARRFYGDGSENYTEEDDPQSLVKVILLIPTISAARSPWTSLYQGKTERHIIAGLKGGHRTCEMAPEEEHVCYRKLGGR